MQALGFDTGLSTTPITPVMLGEAPLAQQFSRRLLEEGVFAMAIGFPTVPKGKARIRVMNSAAHSPGDIEIALETFSKVGRELGVDHVGSRPACSPPAMWAHTPAKDAGNAGAPLLA